MSSPPLNPTNPTGSSYRRPGVARHAAKAEPDEFDDDLEPPALAEVRRSATVLRIVLATIALVGVGVVYALGGFDRAPGVSHDLPVAQPNKLFIAGIWEVTIESATAGNELRGVRPQDDGNYLIEVDATLTNRRERTEAVFDRLVPADTVAGLVEKDPSRYVMIRDNRLASYLQPDLTERIAFIWEVKAGTPVPKTMDLTIVGVYPRKTSFAILNYIVPFDDPAATIAVPVTDRTGRP